MGMGMLLRANGLVSSCIVLRTYHFVTVSLLQLSDFSVAFWNIGRVGARVGRGMYGWNGDGVCIFAFFLRSGVCVYHGHRNAAIRSMHIIHACVDQGKVGKVDQGKRRTCGTPPWDKQW